MKKKNSFIHYTFNYRSTRGQQFKHILCKHLLGETKATDI